MVDVLYEKVSIIIFVFVTMYVHGSKREKVYFYIFSKKFHLIFWLLKDQPIEL